MFSLRKHFFVLLNVFLTYVLEEGRLLRDDRAVLVVRVYKRWLEGDDLVVLVVSHHVADQVQIARNRAQLLLEENLKKTLLRRQLSCISPELDRRVPPRRRSKVRCFAIEFLLTP